MYAPYPLIGIGGQRTVVGVERMGCHEDFSARKAAHEGRVIKVARLAAQLDKIAYFQVVERRFSPERPRAPRFPSENGKNIRRPSRRRFGRWPSYKTSP